MRLHSHPHPWHRNWHKALLALCLSASALAHALEPADALALADGDGDTRVATLQKLAASEDARAQALVRALASEAVQLQGEQVLIVKDGQATDAVTGEAVTLGEDASEVTINNRLRGALETALAGMDLLAGDPARQVEAAQRLRASSFDDPDPAGLPLIEKALAGNLDPRARQGLELAQAAILLASDDEAQRLQAAAKLGEARSPIVRPLLQQRLASEPSAAVQAALKASLATLDRSLMVSNTLGQMFTGLSLGSILLLAALGLAITYGLMGVINMAHG